MRFRIAPVKDKATAGKTGSTGDSGESRFGTLYPGMYQLTQTDDNWCHAKSDGVDADGNVIVRAGQRTTVWVFSCQDDDMSRTPARFAWASAPTMPLSSRT